MVWSILSRHCHNIYRRTLRNVNMYLRTTTACCGNGLQMAPMQYIGITFDRYVALLGTICIPFSHCLA